MSLKKYLTLIFTGLTFTCFAQNTASLSITNDSKLTISKYIYGQFAEHLGHGIYGGFWVDKSLPVEKQDRIRLDVVNALKKIKIPSLRWPGAPAHDYFASVRTGKSYVSLYLLVAARYPEALEGSSDALLGRRSGKAAFTFPGLDDL